MGHKGERHEKSIAEAMPNSKKIKRVALAIVELRLSEDIRQLFS